jgi:hypothetical protein
MTEDLKPADMDLRCEAMTLRGRRCNKRATSRYNASDYCGTHYMRCKKVFMDAEQRWKDAGNPESDL